MKQRLWSIQHIDAYRVMEQTGVLRANEDYLLCKDYEELTHAYNWLVRQMEKKIGPPPEGVRYPVWAWYQRDGRRKKCDMHRAEYAPRGTPLVQLEIELDESCFVLSDFCEWHDVLNGRYVADDGTDDEEVCRKPSAEYKILAERSWEKIFDMHPDARWRDPFEKKWIQATMWEVKMEQVRKATFFTAK